MSVAQLRFEEDKWVLYWSDRNGKRHLYDLFDPNPDLSAALAEVDDDPTAIFWG